MLCPFRLSHCDDTFPHDKRLLEKVPLKKSGNGFPWRSLKKSGKFQHLPINAEEKKIQQKNKKIIQSGIVETMLSSSLHTLAKKPHDNL